MKMLSPWEVQVNRIRAFFAKDERVTVRYNPKTPEVALLVKGTAKAEALEYLMPSCYEYGSVVLYVNIVPDNSEPDELQIVKDALEGNKAVSRFETLEQGPMAGATYVVFQPDIVQFLNDDISDVDGKHSTLMQYLAGKIFDPEMTNGFFFCTEKV